MSNLPDSIRNNRAFVAVMFGALLIGVGAGYWLSRPAGSSAGKPDQPIQWHKVQGVPTRAPDTEDKEWQQRSDALDNEAAAAANEAEANRADAARLENAASQ